jgi:hypothetical protein
MDAPAARPEPGPATATARFETAPQTRRRSMNSSNLTDRQTAAALRELEDAILADDIRLVGKILGANPNLYEAIIEAALVGLRP